MAFAAFRRDVPNVRHRALPVAGAALLMALVASSVFLVWYAQTIPRFHREHALLALLRSQFTEVPWWGLAVHGLTVGGLVAAGVAGLLRKPAVARPLAVVGLVSAAFQVAQFERAREFVRGPFLMPGYMYVNGVLLAEEHRHQADAVSSQGGYWYQRSPHVSRGSIGRGAYLFSRNCAACHTISGINGIRQRARGRSEDGLLVIVEQAHELASFMPPFVGTDEERRDLVRFIRAATRSELDYESRSRSLPLLPDTSERGER
jgi:mono/diheme cytochrome c family protein